MLSPKNPGNYRKVFELSVRNLEFDYLNQRRRFRYTWPEPGGHAPYAIEYWAEFTEDIYDPYLVKIMNTEPYPVGTLFVKWRDNVGDFIVQKFPLYLRLRKAASTEKTNTPEELISKSVIWSVACTNLRNSERKDICGCRVTKLSMTYDKISWGCRQCIPTQKLVFEYPLNEYKGDQDWWYDRILGITPDPYSFGPNTILRDSPMDEGNAMLSDGFGGHGPE